MPPAGVERPEEAMLAPVFARRGSCGGGGNSSLKLTLLEGGPFDKDPETVEVDRRGGKPGRGVSKLSCKAFKSDIELEWSSAFGGDDEATR